MMLAPRNSVALELVLPGGGVLALAAASAAGASLSPYAGAGEISLASSSSGPDLVLEASPGGSLVLDAGLSVDQVEALAPFFQGPQGPAGSGGGGAGFLPVPDLTDETDLVNFFFGWEDVDSDWLVQRQARATGISESATGATNPGISSLALAWASRSTLTYI